MKKRICLFAGFDSKGLIQDYVIYYLKNLSQISDIYYLIETEVNQSEIQKIAPYVKGAYAYKHDKYDFGSWQELINKIGWETVEKYDDLILANDSCYAPIYPLEKMFDYMDEKTLDFWGATENRQMFPHHLQSYFLVFSSKVIKNKRFRDFIDSVQIEEQRRDITRKYEFRLTQMLANEGFLYKAYMDRISGNIIASSTYMSLLNNKCPFFKVKQFTLPTYVYPITEKSAEFDCLEKIKQTGYPIELIEKHLINKEEENVFERNKRKNELVKQKLAELKLQAEKNKEN